jgi:hypothetical protein
MCKITKPLNNFYYRNRKKADGSIYVFYENTCKPCRIKEANKNPKNLTKDQIIRYAKSKNKKRNIERKQAKAKKMGITYENLDLYLKNIKEISVIKKRINRLRVRLNKCAPTRPLFYKIKYHINDIDWSNLIKDDPSNSALMYRIRYKYEDYFALQERLRNQITKKRKKYPNLDTSIRNSLVKNINTKYFTILGYNKEDLHRHIESQFSKGMSWSEFKAGNIHIDHIKPQSLFDLQNINSIIECWSLDNLQPLWASDNLSKSNFYEH